MAHTPVDTIFGLMPVMRARSELRRRRAHGVAERGVPEQPPQPDGDDRHDDEHQQLAAPITSMPSPGCHVPLNRRRGSCVCNVPVR